MKRKVFLFIFGIIFLGLNSVFALTLPKIWVASETIRAEDLNANFSAVQRAWGSHDELTNLDYSNANHTNFAYVNGSAAQFFEGERFTQGIDRLAPIIASNTFPATETIWIGDLLLYQTASAENVLYQAQGTLATSVPTLSTYTADLIYSADTPGKEAWRVFGSGYWRAQSLGPWYVGYKFAASQTINMVQIQGVASVSALYKPKNWIIQASNDGLSWTNLLVKSNAIPTNNGTFWEISNSTPYQYWRLYISSTSSTNNCAVEEIQFYSYTKEWKMVNIPGYNSGIATTVVFPYEFGVSSWTMIVINGFIASISIPAP